LSKKHVRRIEDKMKIREIGLKGHCVGVHSESLDRIHAPTDCLEFLLYFPVRLQMPFGTINQNVVASYPILQLHRWDFSSYLLGREC